MPYKNREALNQAETTAQGYAINKALGSMGARVIDDKLAGLNGNVVKSYAAAGNKVAKSYLENGEKIAKSAGDGGTIGTNIDPTTGLGVDGDGFGTVAALRREALSDTVRNITYGRDAFLFYKRILENAIPASQTVEQYTLFDKRSPVNHGLTNYEGMVSRPTAPHMVRKFVPMKYISKTNQMSLQATLVSSVEDPIAVYDEDAITGLISAIEWQCFYGDADLSNSAEPKNGTEFDGLNKLIPESNVIDAGGSVLSAKMLSDAAMLIQMKQGHATDIFLPVGVQNRFVNEIMGTKALQQVGVRDTGTDAYKYGFAIDKFITSTAGRLNINGSTVMNMQEQYDPDGVGSAGDALKPVVAAEKVENAGGKFRKGFEVHEDGSDAQLNYKVVATVGVDTATPAELSINIQNPTDAVKLSITVPSLADNIADFVTVYRQAEDGFFWALKRIGLRDANADGVIEFIDKNDRIAGTADVFVGDMSKNVIGLYQLLPIDVLPLAQFSATYTWTYLWFGALALFIPKRWVRIKNVANTGTEFAR